ncbi:hypothetical protein ACHAQH_001613 [Verticillium albo-atrum]
MTSWYKNILTNTTSQLSSLQSRLLQSENDGDTEDDTHVCRVLRAYYTQEQRPFPGWLPPDPKAPPPVAPVYASSQPQVGARYGAAASGGQLNGGQGSGSLSSLWDRNPGQQGQNAPQSLRQGRGGMQQQQQQQRVSPFAQGGVDDRPSTGGRAGSYQSGSVYSQGSTNAPAQAATGGGSAQDRLKQRLWGGGTRTTSPGAGSQGPFQPPSGGGGGGGDYEDRFAPGGQYDARGGGDRPYVGSNSPWSSNEPAYGGGGGGGRPAQGLPSGPRRQGLPSGPRMR